MFLPMYLRFLVLGATCQLTRLQDNNTVTVSYTQRVNYIPTRLGVNYTEARDGCHALSMTLPTTHEKECVNYYLTKNLGTGGSGWITPKDVPVNSVPKYGLASRPLPDGTDLFIPSNRKFMIHICLGPRVSGTFQTSKGSSHTIGLYCKTSNVNEHLRGFGTVSPKNLISTSAQSDIRFE